MSSKYNISYSLIRSFKKYMSEEECGHLIMHKNFWKTIPEETFSTEEMRGGIWFEYKFTGALPRSGEIPEPKKTKTGLSALYETLSCQLEFAKALYESEEQLMLEVGKRFEFEIAGFKYVVVYDVKTQNYVRDIKTTGLVGDGVFNADRSPYGWEENQWSLLRDKPLMDQGKMYTLANLIETGELKPFRFDIFSNKTVGVCKSIELTMTEDAVMKYRDQLVADSEFMINTLQSPLEPKPTTSRCAKCPIRDLCEYKTNIPATTKIEYK